MQANTSSTDTRAGLHHTQAATLMRRRHAFIRHYSLPLAFVILIAVASIMPAIMRGVPYGPDLSAHLRNTLSFNEALNQGDPYQSWLAETNGGYGDPSMRLYPPALHYLFAATHAVTGNWYAAILLAFTLLAIAGNLGVYFWARSFCAPRYAVFASLFYAFAPFHANELYQSALLAEYAGGAALAFSFAFTERVCRRGRMSDVACLALSFALLVYTHIPLALMGAMALPLYALLRIERGTFRQTSIKLALAALIAAMTSALYWTTLLVEQGWVKGDKVEPGVRYNYALNFLFKSFSTEDARNWWINIVALAMLALLWPALAKWRANASAGQGTRNERALKLLLIFSFLMATPLSWPVWKVVPKLGSIEFPWRWLAVTSLAGSVALAAGLHVWLEKARTRLRPLALLAAGSAVIALAFTISHPMRGALYLARPKFDAMLRELPGSAGFDDGLPVWAVEKPRPMESAVEAGTRAVNIESWQSEQRVFSVSAGDATEARARTFYHPYWTVTADGASVPTRPANDGALLFSLPPAATTVHLQFVEPQWVRLTALASLVGLLLTCALFAFQTRAHARHSPLIAPKIEPSPLPQIGN